MKTVDTPLPGVSVSIASNSNLLTASRCSLLLLTRPPQPRRLSAPSPRSPITSPVRLDRPVLTASSSNSNLVSAVSLLLSLLGT